MTSDLLEIMPHEIIRQLESVNVHLANDLVKMFNEDHSHQTERRGCGFTQASRFIADFINLEQSQRKQTILMLNKSYQSQFKFLSSDNAEDKKDQFKKDLLSCKESLLLEESQMFFQIFFDVFFNYQEDDLLQIKNLSEKPKVGSCTLAEKFFLEMAYNCMPRTGLINIVLDEQSNPVMIEKINMGDSHSCISLVPLLMNGIRLPAGSLFSTVAFPHSTDTDHYVQCKNIRGNLIPLIDYQGFWFLRLTTLSVSVKNRQRAFSHHLKWQKENGLFSCDEATIQMLYDFCLQQL